MPISKQNIEKLQTLTTLFVKNMREEYFVKLLEVYTLLQKTLLDKKYVEELTEEKLDLFVSENDSILAYFEYLGFKLFVKGEVVERLKKNGKVSFLEQLRSQYFNFEYLRASLPEKRKSEITLGDENNKGSYYYSSILTNLKYPKFSHYIEILKSFNFNAGTELSNENIKFLESEIYLGNEYLQNIPAGIIFYHFCEWYSEEYIETVEINNYFSIKNIKLENLNSKEIYLLGENGVGKTILLQAILFALKGNLNSIAEEVKRENSFFQEKIYNISFFFTPHYRKKEYVYAYGVNRTNIVNSISNSDDEYSTLFIGDAELLDPELWLSKLYTFDLEEITGKRKIIERLNLEKAKELLTNLFEKEVFIEVDGDGVTFTEKGTNPLEFRQLSDGYKSVLIWVSDLIQRMSKEQSHITKLQDFRGVVLIDELDMFLHPKWAYKIMEKLRGWFPKVQFIISTHSPVLILGASKEAIFYKVYKENGETKISEPITDISGLMANTIITSPLFGMKTAKQSYIKSGDENTDDDYAWKIIHDVVSEKIEKEANITKDEVYDFIKNKIENF